MAGAACCCSGLEEWRTGGVCRGCELLLIPAFGVAFVDGLVFGGGLTPVSSSEEESEVDDGGAGFFWVGLLVEWALEDARVEEDVLGADFGTAVFLGGLSSSLLLLESEEETSLTWDFLLLTVCSTLTGLFLVGAAGLGVRVELLSFLLFFFSVLFSRNFFFSLAESCFLTFSRLSSLVFFLFFFFHSTLNSFSSGPLSSVGLCLFLQPSLV